MLFLVIMFGFMFLISKSVLFMIIGWWISVKMFLICSDCFSFSELLWLLIVFTCLFSISECGCLFNDGEKIAVSLSVSWWFMVG